MIEIGNLQQVKKETADPLSVLFMTKVAAVFTCAAKLVRPAKPTGTVRSAQRYILPAST